MREVGREGRKKGIKRGRKKEEERDMIYIGGGGDQMAPAVTEARCRGDSQERAHPTHRT